MRLTILDKGHGLGTKALFAVIRTMSRQPVLDVIVKISQELCSSDASTIFLLRDGKFHVTAVAGIIPVHLDTLRANPAPVDQPGSILARIAREKRTLHYANVTDDPELKAGITGRGGPKLQTDNSQLRT